MLLPLGQPLLLGSTTALATAAAVLSTQAAHAQSAEGYLDAGIEKGRSGDYQEAIADYNKAIEIIPQYASAFGNRGSAKLALKDYQGSIADFNNVLEIDAKDALAYFSRGFAKSHLRNYRGAVADFNKAIEIIPQFAPAYSARGYIRGAKFGNDIGACQDYKKAALFGYQPRSNWLKSRDGSWCRNMQ